MSRFERMRGRLRRAYESGREAARTRRADPEAAPGEAGVASPASPGPSASPEATVVGVEPPAAMHSSTVSRDDTEVPHALRITAAWCWRLIVIGIVTWALIKIIGTISIVIIPLTVALLLSALLAPAVGWLLRARLPRSLATGVVLVGGLAAVVGTLTLVVNEFIKGVPELSEKSSQGIRQIQDWFKTGPLHLSDSQLDRYINEAQNWINGNTERFTSGALSTAATLAEVLTGTVLVLFATFFFLRDGNSIWRFLVRLLPVAARWKVDDAGRASWATLGAYVRATVLVAFIDAVGIGIFLVLFDIPFAFPLAALVFLGAFIPIVGAFLSGVVAVLVALVDSGPVTALIILGVVVGVQQVEGHVLQPLIMGRAVAIHPLAVIIGIAAGVVLAGIAGALVAVPLIAVLNTAVRRLAARTVPDTPPDAVVVASQAP
ncbi:MULTISPECIES: AI-2E family transporter [Micromonospora]|uniref:AI-2E family transporter n=1 Tax=Micromonospora TaxID=1873 RepID=UPI000ADB72AB|nr:MULTISPECIES: AI-2E family transporter [Micromonospora]MBP1785925.1 putative PurR-regulated permease PerM [Micromonospora sp. HB375]MCK1810231.1 AI-2E family transporter [Micromonospora sp. R42106]MCK1835553.1 AI-2E family transporter [Micromonospora sp. R42003]MCK1847485.1 AI-2E family transporter [Micromonospora sp. R42004]MCM1016771.1 AI-2E family transporter [Micromonospora sp. XM-20-01]